MNSNIELKGLKMKVNVLFFLSVIIIAWLSTVTYKVYKSEDTIVVQDPGDDPEDDTGDDTGDDTEER